MPSHEDFQRIDLLARQAAGTPGQAYVPWLIARSAGLKAQAKTALGAFLDEATAWPEPQKRGFALWLDRVAGDLDDPAAVTPHPLMVRLILPTLRAWVAAEPDNATPHLLHAHYHRWPVDATPPLDHFRRALERDPGLVPARRGVIAMLCDMVERNQHHLPGAYLGDREQDAARMEEAAALARDLPDQAEAAERARHASLLRDRALGRRADGGLATYGFTPRP